MLQFAHECRRSSTYKDYSLRPTAEDVRWFDMRRARIAPGKRWCRRAVTDIIILYCSRVHNGHDRHYSYCRYYGDGCCKYHHHKQWANCFLKLEESVWPGEQARHLLRFKSSSYSRLLDLSLLRGLLESIFVYHLEGVLKLVSSVTEQRSSPRLPNCTPTTVFICGNCKCRRL